MRQYTGLDIPHRRKEYFQLPMRQYTVNASQQLSNIPISKALIPVFTLYS